jgi:hypothetical protein
MAAWTYVAQVHQPSHFTRTRDFPLLILHVRRPDQAFAYGGQRITVWISWAKSFEKKRSRVQSSATRNFFSTQGSFSR